jgi:uncharacterized protein (TIGR02145 family)
MSGKNLLQLLFVLFFAGSCDLSGQIVRDADNNVYSSVAIGKQVWLTENLKTTKFNDGTSITQITEDKKWRETNTPAYCWLNNDITNRDVYGALYNWHTVNTKKLCPKGWHIPSDTEWETMIITLGDISLAGGKLKEKGDTHWKKSLYQGTDEFGFSAMPGGMRLFSGPFPEFANSYAVWWSTTEHIDLAWNRGLYYSTNNVYRGCENKRSGFSVRCLKD